MEKSINSNHVDEVNMSFPPPYMAGNPRGYALSGKIMLSAIIILFAVVVIMVCLHVYARWYILRARRRNIRHARRRTHLVFYIDSNSPSNIAPVSHGIDPSVLKSLPTFTFNKNEKIEHVKEDDMSVLECAVCLSEFEENEEGRVLPKCNHCFHVECIDMWFHSHDTCPLCRAPVEAADVAVKEGGDNEVVVEMGELTQCQPGEVSAPVVPGRVEVGPSSSFGGRRKGSDLVGFTVEVPRRCQSFSFTNSDGPGPSRSPVQGFRSPTSRILSLKRILSRDKRPPLHSHSPSQGASELDIESGRVEPETPPVQGLTPR